MALPLADGTTTLRIMYETDALLPALDVANVLKEVSTAFERYTKRRGRYRSLRLAVKRVEVGIQLVQAQREQGAMANAYQLAEAPLVADRGRRTVAPRLLTLEGKFG